jgi:ATP-dependent Lhr-like helicase
VPAASGTLKCVVCTSSRDLGVDFAPVDQVLQVGSPKGIARLLQRAGRSRHRPGEASRVLCVPTHALELAEAAAARRAVALGRVEARRPLARCLDVLAQHLVTLAAGPGFVADELLAEVRGTHAYAALTDVEWRWTLDFVTRGGQALAAYPQYRRVVERDGVHRVEDTRLARLHRTQIGTITSDGSLELRWLSGGSLGTVEEGFLARRKPGDTFVFAGRVLQLVRVRDMVGYVRLATRRAGTVPRWNGGRMPLSTELADSLLEVLADAAAADSPELALLAPLLELQARWSRIPRREELLVELHRTRQGHHLFLYPFAGRAVHEGLATLVAHRLAREAPATFTLSYNDYGLELLAPKPIEIDEARLRRVLAPEGLADDLVASVNVSEVARRQFRDIARIAGLVMQGMPGRAKTTRQLQASSGLIYDVLVRYDPSNLLVDQATREVLEGQLETVRLRACLERIAAQRLVLLAPPRLTPLAFPLWAESLQSQILSTESWEERVLRMVESLERAASPRESRRA